MMNDRNQQPINILPELALIFKEENYLEPNVLLFYAPFLKPSFIKEKINSKEITMEELEKLGPYLDSNSLFEILKEKILEKKNASVLPLFSFYLKKEHFSQLLQLSLFPFSHQNAKGEDSDENF